MNSNDPASRTPGRRGSAVAALVAGVLASSPAWSDEGGISAWLPGQVGSLAAVPGAPGWSLPVVYYHTDVDAGADRSFAVAGRIAVGLKVKADLLVIVPTYTFATPLWGGQARISATTVFGTMDVSATATLTGPGGAVASANVSDSVTGIGDVFPMASVRWKDGVHHWLAYTQTGLPVGSYEVGRLANLGINHSFLDAGGGYTYLDMATGREVTAVIGATYNFENRDTDYRNGTSLHLDWAASQFLSPHWHVGVTGYHYQQVTGDSGSGATLGDFKSRVSSVGLQAGHLFAIGGQPAYFNVKAHHEFGARNRPEGWNAWLTLAMPLGSPVR